MSYWFFRLNCMTDITDVTSNLLCIFSPALRGSFLKRWDPSRNISFAFLCHLYVIAWEMHPFNELVPFPSYHQPVGKAKKKRELEVEGKENWINFNWALTVSDAADWRGKLRGRLSSTSKFIQQFPFVLRGRNSSDYYMMMREGEGD